MGQDLLNQDNEQRLERFFRCFEQSSGRLLTLNLTLLCRISVELIGVCVMKRGQANRKHLSNNYELYSLDHICDDNNLSS